MHICLEIETRPGLGIASTATLVQGVYVDRKGTVVTIDQLLLSLWVILSGLWICRALLTGKGGF
jgi:hypothetical protein